MAPLCAFAAPTLSGAGFLGAALSVVVVSVAAGSVWPQFGRNAQHAALASASGPSGPTVVAAWTFNASSFVESSPVIAEDGTVCDGVGWGGMGWDGVGWKGCGRMGCCFADQSFPIAACAELPGSQVFVGCGSNYCTDDCNLYALNGTSGQLLWSFATPGKVWCVRRGRAGWTPVPPFLHVPTTPSRHHHPFPTPAHPAQPPHPTPTLTTPFAPHGIAGRPRR
jgi:hypothetical protein